MRTFLLFASILVLLTPVYTQQPGSLDQDYGNGGITPVNPYSNIISSMVVQPDGKLIIRTDYNMNSTIVSRFTLNGRLDSSFQNDGILEIKNFYGTYSDNLALGPDGKLFIAETRFGPVGNANTDVFVRRYNSNGRRDISFGDSGVVHIDLSFRDEAGNFTFIDDDLLSMAVQANGDIVLAILYYRTDDPETGYSAIVNCNSDGIITNVWKLPSQPFDYFEQTQVSALKGGGYMFTTEAENFAGTFIYSTKFGQKVLSPLGGWIAALKHHVLDDGKIAILNAQRFIGDDDTPFRTFVRLLNSDGSPDTTFSGDGMMSINGFLGSVSSQKDGKLILSGGSRIVRINANGSLDATFGDGGSIDFSNQKGTVYGNRLYVAADENIAAILLSTDPRMIKVNLHGNSDAYNHGEWNNWNNLRNLHFDNFYYADSTASGIDAVMSNRSGVNDNGANYGGSNTLMAPKGVLRHSSYSIGARTVTLNNLTPTKKYDLEFYASRNDHSSNSTVFTINGVAKTVSTYRNFTRKVIFDNLTPNAQGQIVINLKSTRDYNYLNGFVLTEKFNITTAATTAVQESNTELMVVEKEKVTTEDVTVFPNPTANYFTLKLQNKNSQPVQLTITDATGKIVEARTTAANTILTFGHNYKPGIYYVQVRNGLTQQILKLIKK